MAKITQCKGERLFEMPRKDSLARRCLTTTTTHLLYSELGASQFSRNRSDHRPLYGCEASLCFGTRRETTLFLCLDFPKIKSKESMGDRHSDSEREWDGLAARQGQHEHDALSRFRAEADELLLAASWEGYSLLVCHLWPDTWVNHIRDGSWW